MRIGNQRLSLYDNYCDTYLNNGEDENGASPTKDTSPDEHDSDHQQRTNNGENDFSNKKNAPKNNMEFLKWLICCKNQAKKKNSSDENDEDFTNEDNSENEEEKEHSLGIVTSCFENLVTLQFHVWNILMIILNPILYLYNLFANTVFPKLAKNDA